MKTRFNYPSARPWILTLGLTLVILLMGYAYHKALQRIQKESLCIRHADQYVASIYYSQNRSEHITHVQY